MHAFKSCGFYKKQQNVAYLDFFGYELLFGQWNDKFQKNSKPAKK